MANFLGYDSDDLELTEVHSNSELRKLLMKNSSKSIIAIEDINCSVNLSNRSKAPHAPASRSYDDPGAPNAARGGGGGEDGNNNTITLTGLLNFTDGLWSCCGSERNFVFATNHIEKLDPALLRSGRMDMHIYMSYCSYPALKILLRNYLGGGEAEDLLGGDEAAAAGELREAVEKAKITPADIGEVLLMKSRRNKERAVGELLEALRARAERNEMYGGGVREECGLNGVAVEEEEEEQEKRALESPKENSDRDDDPSCEKLEDDEAEAEAEKKFGGSVRANSSHPARPRPRPRPSEREGAACMGEKFGEHAHNVAMAMAFTSPTSPPTPKPLVMSQSTTPVPPPFPLYSY